MASSDLSEPAVHAGVDSSNATEDEVSTPSARTGSPASWEDTSLDPPADPRVQLMRAKREKHGRADPRPKGRFRDLVFKQTFSAFDRKNEAAANSPFYGFFTLSWLALALFMLKTAVENWKVHGNPLGTNDIMRLTFSRDGKQHPVVCCPFFTGAAHPLRSCLVSNMLALTHQSSFSWRLTEPCALLRPCPGCSKRPSCVAT